MPLSEREERIFAEIQATLHEDDPAFEQRAERQAAQRRSRRLRYAVLGFVLGLSCLLGLVFSFVLGLIGAAIMFASLIIALSAARDMRGGGEPLVGRIRKAFTAD